MFTPVAELIPWAVQRGWEPRQLARLCNCTVGTVYSLLRRDYSGKKLDNRRLRRRQLFQCCKCKEVWPSGQGKEDSICCGCLNRLTKAQRAADPGPSRKRRRASYARRKHSAVTYFVQGANLVKIGTTTNLPERLVTLQIGSPVSLTVLGVTYIPEAQLHKQFAQVRHHGEWFSLTADVQAFIDAYVFPFRQSISEGAHVE